MTSLASNSNQHSMNRALLETFREALTKDERVVILGEDLDQGGQVGALQGLREAFGEDRVMEVCAGGGRLVGHALGLALAGARPIVEMPIGDAWTSELLVLQSELARRRWRTAGRELAPVILRFPSGAIGSAGPELSTGPEAVLAGIPGLIVGCASSAASARAWIQAGLAGRDALALVEPRALHASSQASDEREASDLTRAHLTREGQAATIVAWGSTVRLAWEVAEEFSAQGREIGVLDLARLAPIDEASLLAAARDSGRVIIVHEGPRRGGIGAEVAAIIAERAIEKLEAPVLRVAGWDTPVPRIGEVHWLPNHDRIRRALEQVLNF